MIHPQSPFSDSSEQWLNASTLTHERQHRLNLILVDLESEYRSILQRLGKREKSDLEGKLTEQIDAERTIIEQNIYRDKQHLAIVNFCADKFGVGSRLSTRTGYLCVRVEPLYGLG